MSVAKRLVESQMGMRADLTGEKELLRRFNHLGKTAAKRVLRKATRAGTAPMVKAAKRNAPRATGELKKDLTQKQKFYANTGTQVGLVGAKKRKDGKSRSTWILHLVEDGTQAHVIKPKNKKALAFEGLSEKAARAKATRKAKRTGTAAPEAERTVRASVRHPGITGTRFLRKSFDQTQAESVKKFQDKMAVEIEVEARKTV